MVTNLMVSWILTSFSVELTEEMVNLTIFYVKIMARIGFSYVVKINGTEKSSQHYAKV
jgi:hypothetical protein